MSFIADIRSWRARGRARRGANFLDRYASYWFLWLDLDRLNMHSNNRCVAGQLIGGYTTPKEFARTFGVFPTATWMLGVFVRSPKMADALQVAWHHEITQRLKAYEQQEASALVADVFSF